MSFNTGCTTELLRVLNGADIDTHRYSLFRVNARGCDFQILIGRNSLLIIT